MLAASIKVSNIAYEESFQHIFPMVKEKIEAMESENLIIRLFQKLGDAALPILTDLMYRLPEGTKNELFVLCLNAYEPKLKQKLNEELSKSEWGKYFTVGSLRIAQKNQELFLQIDRIKADYLSLLNMNKMNEKLEGYLGGFAGVAKGLTGLAFTYAPDMLERKGLEFLWKDNNKQKLTAIAKSSLDKYGIFMELEDIQIRQDIDVDEDIIEEEIGLVLTEKMESDILDALAGYLKEKTADTAEVS